MEHLTTQELCEIIKNYYQRQCSVKLQNASYDPHYRSNEQTIRK